MHTTVLVLGVLLILSELGAIGFLAVNTIRHFTQPRMAIYLVSDRSLLSRRTLKVTIIEKKRVQTVQARNAADDARDPVKADGYFSLTP